MIRVGFIVLTSDKWTGGSNYFKNLLYAISKLNAKKIQPVLFFATNENSKVVESFEPLGETVKTDILDQNSFPGLLNALLMRLFNKSILLEGLFKENKIQVVSHSRFIDTCNDIKTINWITDFQHIHLPGMFSALERKYRDTLFLRFAKYSDSIILSSNDAYKDYKKLYPKYLDKAKVLHFVSQPDKRIYQVKDVKGLEQKYKIAGKFFFLPNQFWKHKNHMVVFKAVNLLKKQDKGVFVVCSGYMDDYRNRAYLGKVMQYIKINKLEENIKFLGLIDHKDVLTLMRYCVSIINPSLFEGWSTAVEEAKSIRKNIILSDIAVHKEQDPPNATYFNPNNEKDLAIKMWRKWQESDGGPDLELEKDAKKKIKKRTFEFGKGYQDIVVSIT